MIGLGLEFERTNQNLIDFFPSHTISNVSKSVSGKGWQNSSKKVFIKFIQIILVAVIKKSFYYILKFYQILIY